jgi:hypothetical protein
MIVLLLEEHGLPTGRVTILIHRQENVQGCRRLECQYFVWDAQQKPERDGEGSCLTRSLSLFDLRVGVFEGDGSIKDEPAWRGIGVDTEVPHAFELQSGARGD